jgi:cytoskeletal protein CcmA (bactofilin family)
MVNNSRNDLRINGVGSSSGGSYNFVQINGKGDINGDLECDELQVNGLGCVHGNVKTGSARTAGKSEIDGNLDGQEIIIDGMTEIGGSIKADKVENRGMLKVNKDCGSESFRSQGGFTIGGLLNAGKIDIELYVSSSAREIGGEEIQIRAGTAFGLKKFLNSIFPAIQFNRGLSADSIEGDSVYLENATVKVVRGRDVKIGPGCQIGTVEYRNTFHKDGSATIKEDRKI